MRRLAAGITGLAAGVAVFAGLAGAGYLLITRLSGGSAGLLVVISITFGAIGLYAGWLAAVLVFSAVRGRGGETGGAGA